ncbi:MAG: AbrB/MazE/SpoVT family DNA-binding domain-containing protein [Patescibacteria group bacterium]
MKTKTKARRRRQTPHSISQYIGTVTVGERGQVVIPADLRHKLRLTAGTKMVVWLSHGRMMGMLKAEDMSSFIQAINREFKRFKLS